MMFVETLLDVSSSQRHSLYFNETRSSYLFRRIRVIATILALVQPAWLFVDYLLLAEEMLRPIGICRLVASIGCIVLVVWSYKRYNLSLAYLRLFTLVVILSLFHLASSSLLLMNGFSSDVAGYHFFPFMIVCMMAVFPLSIVEAFAYSLCVIVFELATQFFRGVLGDTESLNSLWLLSVLAVIAGWASVNQLNMLLSLYRQATRDPLTGLSNRRQAMEQLSSGLLHSRENAQPLSVMLFDLDKFKLFNDTYGHAAGDIVLQEFAKVLQKQARKRLDLSCRYGGEEFLMIMPNMDEQGAKEMAEAIRQACHDTSVKGPSGDALHFTTSIGVSGLKGDDDSVEQLLKRADDALYKAKDNGRDQVVVFG